MPATATKFYACTQFDDAGQCVAAVWVDQPMAIPPLSLDEGGVIGMNMFFWIATVYIVRKLTSVAQ